MPGRRARGAYRGRRDERGVVPGQPDLSLDDVIRFLRLYAGSTAMAYYGSPFSSSVFSWSGLPAVPALSPHPSFELSVSNRDKRLVAVRLLHAATARNQHFKQQVSDSGANGTADRASFVASEIV